MGQCHLSNDLWDVKWDVKLYLTRMIFGIAIVHVLRCASEQVLSPLHFVDKLCEVDFEATVHEGGTVGQAGAVRYALSKALLSIVDADTTERMRLGWFTESR